MDEFTIIEKYFADIGLHHDGVILGPGDDCALLAVPEGSELCVSTDTLVSGVHFPELATGDVVADRSMAANISDLAAMGAKPFCFLLALSISEANQKWLHDFSSALSLSSRQYQLPLVGGNLCRGNLSVTLTVMGTLPAGSAMTRQGGRPGDVIYVTGNLGAAAAGLRIHSENVKGPKSLEDAYLHPLINVDFAQGIRGVATACIDISDGFLADLDHLCRASGAGAVLEPEKIHIMDELFRFVRNDALDYALTGGDDYELCFCVPDEKCELVEETARRTDTVLSRVGSLVPEDGLWSLKAGKKTTIPIRGYKHF